MTDQITLVGAVPTLAASTRAPAGVLQAITFAGSLTDAAGQSSAHSFVVLAGDGAPTVTGGFAKWQVVDRPQIVGTTVLQGYDPITLVVPILFDEVAYPSVNQGRALEDDIQILEWMGGRGQLYSNSPFSPAFGDSPLITLVTADSSGTPTPLVPASYQALVWVITGIDYDPNPLRARNGHRIRQAVTVTLTQHVSGPFDTAADSPATRAASRAGNANKTFTVTVKAGLRTYQQIATRSAHNTAAAARIRDANANTKGISSVRSVNADLPLGAKVKVPVTVRKPA